MPSDRLEWHGHNDFNKAVINGTVAWMYGASAVNCSLLGIGERTGNIPLESMVFEYAARKGTLDGMDLSAITDIAHYYEDEVGYEIPKMTPFVGEYFNLTRAGIHADGADQGRGDLHHLRYEGVASTAPWSSPSAIRPPLRVSRIRINAYFNLPEEDKISKQDPLVAGMKEWVDAQYTKGARPRSATKSDRPHRKACARQI